MKIHYFILSLFLMLSFSVQAEDSPSYWDSIVEKVGTFVDDTATVKDELAEKAKNIKDDAVTAKDDLVNKTSDLIDDTATVKNSIVGKAKGFFNKPKILRFEEVYHKAFWKNDAVFWSAIAVASAGAAAVTVYTAGTGAPAAGAGVSYVASQLVAGGGAGSYMAGLSTVGAWFGGNAITGAAILNATSAAILGYGGEAMAIKGISVTTKLALAAASNLGKFGFVYLPLKEESEATHIIQIMPSGHFGTDKVENLLTRLKNYNETLTTTLEKTQEVQTELNTVFEQTQTLINEGYQSSVKVEMLKHLTQLKTLNNNVIDTEKKAATEKLNAQYQLVVKDARKIIDNYFNNERPADVRNDAIMATVLLHNLGYEADFIKYIKQFEVLNQQESFMFYLKAAANLMAKDFKFAQQYAVQAIDSEPEAIEPIMILMMALDGLGKYEQAFETELLLQEEFDDDHYETPNSLVTAYNLLGDIANARELPRTAAKFHEKALDNLAFLADDDEKAFICLKIANDYHMFGSKTRATDYYEKAMDYVEDENLKQEITRFFEKEIKTQTVN